MLGEPQVKNDGSGKSNEHPYFGFVMAFVPLLASLVLFFGWETFGNEVVLKIVAAFLLGFGLIGFGVELSNHSNDDGALEAGMGLALTFFILMFKDAVPGTPNLIVLVFLSLGIFCIGLSVTRLLPSTQKNKKSKASEVLDENKSTKKMYTFIIIGGQVLGAIVNVVNFIRLFQS